MKANLNDDGQLIPPRNVERGRVRLKQLDHEITKLRYRIAELGPGAELPRAERCRDHLMNERMQLVAWIEDQEKENGHAKV